MALIVRSVSVSASFSDSTSTFSVSETYNPWFTSFVSDGDKGSVSSSDDVDTGKQPSILHFRGRCVEQPKQATSIPTVTSHINSNENDSSNFANFVNGSLVKTESQFNEDCDRAKKPMGARPKEFSFQPKSKRASQKLNDKDNQTEKEAKKRGRKIRKEKRKKWQPVDPESLGFHMSLLPLSFGGEYEDHSEDCCVQNVHICAVCGSHQLGQESQVCTEDHKDEERTNVCDDGTTDDRVVMSEYDINEIEHLDDVSFFQALGIDVTEDYDRDDFDYITDWDCVRVGHVVLPSLPQSETAFKPDRGAYCSKAITRPKPSTSKKDTSQKKEPTTAANLAFHDQTTSKLLKKYDVHRLYELECSSKTKIFARRDRHRRTRKVHKDIKSKHCAPFLYNPSKKKTYIHHRLYKLLGGDNHSFWSHRRGPQRMPKNGVDLEVARAISKTSTPRVPTPRPPRVQNLKHALHETNRPNHLEIDLASFLISLQHREMTPEDYEMLLRLDDSVKPKTVSNSFLKNLKTDMVDSESVGVECSVCMEAYESGQIRKFLPCGHVFHSECIDTWLKNSSMNCPLDGLPLEDS